MGRLSKGAFGFSRIVVLTAEVSSRLSLLESMLVLGVAESEALEKVVEKRELELEER